MGEDPVRINQLLDIIFDYGPFWVYGVIFLACFIENILPPFPGDSFIVAAGGLVAVDRIDFAATSFVVISGGISSVMLLYLLGRNFGRDFFMRKNFKYFSADDIANVERQFNKWGVVILIFSRFIVGFRSALALVAGISRFQIEKMFIFSLISYVLFTGLLMYGAIKFVENLDIIRHYFRTYNLIIWPVLIIALALYIIDKFKRVRGNRR